MVMVLVASKKKPPTPIARDLGTKLKAVRERMGKTQEQIAESLGRSFKTVSAYENGRAVIRTDDLGDWARALGISVAELATGLGLCIPIETGNFRQDLTVLFGPDDAEVVENILRQAADLPDLDRRQIIQSIRDQVTGRYARNQRD